MLVLKLSIEFKTILEVPKPVWGLEAEHLQDTFCQKYCSLCSVLEICGSAFGQL